MADGNSTRKCQVCANIYPAKRTKSGLIRKTKLSLCSRKCYDKYRYRQLPGNSVRQRSSRKPTSGCCSVGGCDSQIASGGMCAKHYQRFRKYGDPLYTKHGKRVRKSCAWCGGEMQLKPAQVNKTECCSRSCSNLLRAKREGKTIRLTKFWCAGCHKQVERTVKTSRDSGKYCSKACALAVKSRVSAERAALRRIGDRRRSRERERYDTMVRPEVQALRRIALRCNDPARNIACANCGDKVRRLRPFFKFCSLVCKREKDKKIREEYRQSEAYKALKRAAKSRRRALLRTATADSIDPLKVFERDQWKCHLCGCKTLKSKRGTIHDRAPELEHIISLAEGGTHTWGNVACACRKCNISKGSNSTGQLGLQIAC